MSLTEEESNFLRFYFLNLKIATKAVRVYFDSVHPPAGLAAELTKCSVTLRGLSFMTKMHLSILYPSPPSIVRSEDFDTTLIVCLLRNMTPHASAPVTGWDNLPHPLDTSTGADLARFKWYRNQLVLNEDGKLSPTYFSQFWADLENAIGRLGGPSMLKEAQSARHIILDRSLTDTLNLLGNCEKYFHNLHISIEDNIRMINNLQTAIVNQRNLELNENRIQQLDDPVQKGKSEASKLRTNPPEYKETLDKCTEEIEACKREIENNHETIKGIQEKVVDIQYKVEELTHQEVRLDSEHDIKFQEIDDMLEEHDEQMATCVKEIDNMKKTHYHTDNISGGSKQKRLEEDTKALIEEDVRDGTFVTTKAVTDGLLLLKQNGVLLMTGHAGTGKSRIGRHILHMFCTDNTSHKCMKVNTLEELKSIVSRNENGVVLLDDIFGETNCIFNREKDTPILDKVHAYVCKGKIKIIITIRDTVKRQCQDVFDSHRLFKFDFIDLSSNKYLLSREEKHTILTKYMKRVRQSDYVKSKGFVDCNGDLILKSDEVNKITLGNPVKGIPLVVYQFVHNDKYFKLGSTYFDRQTEAILEEINVIRRKGEDHKKFMMQYAVMVYTAINENCINPEDNTCVKEVLNIIDAIYGVTIKVKKYHILDAVKELKGSYLINIPNQRSYKLHHPTLQESVIISFALIDGENINKILPLISWSFFMRIVKPASYKEKEGEVVLRVPTSSYELLAGRIVDIFMADFPRHIFGVLRNLSNTEIFNQDYHLLLPSILEALEKEDNKDKLTENMIRCGGRDSYLVHMENKAIFFSLLLDMLAKSESQFDIYNFVLQIFNCIIKTSNNYFTIGVLKVALIKSLYEICSTKDIRSVEATLDIVKENKIPILLDQGINITQIKLQDILFLKDGDSEPTCVFLTLCIWNAYKEFNIPVLQFLLSKYIKTPFDVNLFLKMYYKKEWLIMSLISLSTLKNHRISYKPIKWMIESFPDQEILDTDCIFRIACQCQMFDTVEYLASRCESFDAFSCLIAFVDRFDLSYPIDDHPCNQELFNFLLSKIDITSKDLIPVVMSVLQKQEVPDYMFDAFLPVCLNNTDILTLACNNGQFYAVKTLIEKSNLQYLEIQSALNSTCKEIERKYYTHLFNHNHKSEMKKLKIVKYLTETFGFEQFDLRAACEQACHSKKFKIVKWFVQNIDLTVFDLDFILSSALEGGNSEIFEHIMNKIEIESLDKNKVLKYVARYNLGGCSSKILEIVSKIWNNTEDKEELNMEEIVTIAYEKECFELLMWIHDNCHQHPSIDAEKIFILACQDSRIDVVKWLFQVFDQISSALDAGKLFTTACAIFKDFSNDSWIGLFNMILSRFQIKPLDVISGVIQILNEGRCHSFDNKQRERYEFSNLVISTLEKCYNCLSMKDISVMMNKSLKHKYYVLVNWLLVKEGSSLFDKQTILNKACEDDEIETIKILSKYFCNLDMNQAMIIACTSFDIPKSCLNLLWNEIDHDSIDLGKIVSTVNKEKEISNNVMTWILLNLPLDQIQINEVLITCCQQSKIHHVKYIFHEVNNEQLDVKAAFVQACRSVPLHLSIYAMKNLLAGRMLVDYLFQKLHDKESIISIVLNECLNIKRYDLVPYFLQTGFYRNVDMNNLIHEAYGHGHVRLLQWILEHVNHNELDIKFTFYETCRCKQNRIKCLALMWHYIQDINMFEIDTALQSIPEKQSDDSGVYDDITNWMIYIKNINQKMMYTPKRDKIQKTEYGTEYITDWFYKLKLNCDGIDTHCIIDQRLESKYGHLSSLCRIHVRLEHCVHTNITRPRPQIQQDSLSEFECIYLSNTNNNDRDSLLMKNILKDALTNNYDILIRWVIAHMKENGVKLEDMKKTLNLAVKKSNINIAKAISWFITRKFFSEFGTQLAEAIDIYPGIRCHCPVSLLVEDPFCTNIKVIVILTRKTILEKPDKYHGFEIEEINPDLSNLIDSEAVTISNLLSTKYTNSYSLKVDLSQYEVETVFNCHSNITLICPSVLKSRSFSKAHDVQERICIQLYCIKKGIIPLGEDHFPLSINGIPTDVIDGTIGLMTKLRIGDQIGPQTSIGTLGGFVKYFDFDCFLTCAHVMYDLQALLSSSYDFARIPGANAYCHTVQGLVDCGRVIWRSFDHDDKLKTSIDAALVLMQNNAHFDQTDYILDGFGNACPYTKLGLSTPFLNDCCLDREDFCIPHQAATVVGAGSQTKLEQNVIFPKQSDVDILFSSTGQTASVVNGSVFQPLWINSPAHIQIATGFLTEKRIFRMYNQIVLNLGLHPGDSGTCIYVVHHPFNNNGCIGMAIAFCGGMTVVTPLKDILKKMNS